MIYINSVLKDFYYCFNLPICILDSNLNIIDKYGHGEDLEKILEELLLRKDLKKDLCPSSQVYLNYTEDIKFILISKLNNIDINFLIGPFTSNSSASYTKAEIPFKNISCIKYIYILLSNIFNERFIKSYEEGNYSPYIKRALIYIFENYKENITIDTVCKEFNINKSYFCTIFKKETGFTFINYLNNYRIEKSKELLINSNLSLLDIALEVGFNNQSYYSTVFKKFSKITPLEFKENNFTK